MGWHACLQHQSQAPPLEERRHLSIRAGPGQSYPTANVDRFSSYNRIGNREPYNDTVLESVTKNDSSSCRASLRMYPLYTVR